MVAFYKVNVDLNREGIHVCVELLASAAKQPLFAVLLSQCICMVLSETFFYLTWRGNSLDNLMKSGSQGSPRI